MGTISLLAEERFLWQCARMWRNPAQLPDFAGIDWNKLVDIGRANRMQVLLNQIFLATGTWEKLPAKARQDLKKDVDKLQNDALAMSAALRAYLTQAGKMRIETVVHKGLSLSINVYGNPAMRPGNDIDVLVRKDCVADSLRALEEIGISSFWPNLMDDRYYARHHLHQQRSTKDLKIWFEVHWALDHPYTLLTLDYEAMLDRASAGILFGEPVRILLLPDLLISLVVHLAKHAIYLTSVIDRPDLERIILADGMLMYYLDVAEVVKF